MIPIEIINFEDKRNNNLLAWCDNVYNTLYYFSNNVIWGIHKTYNIYVSNDGLFLSQKYGVSLSGFFFRYYCVQKLLEKGCLEIKIDNKSFFYRSLNDNWLRISLNRLIFITFNPYNDKFFNNNYNVDHIDNNPFNNCLYNIRLLNTKINISDKGNKIRPLKLINDFKYESIMFNLFDYFRRLDFVNYINLALIYTSSEFLFTLNNFLYLKFKFLFSSRKEFRELFAIAMHNFCFKTSALDI